MSAPALLASSKKALPYGEALDAMQFLTYAASNMLDVEVVTREMIKNYVSGNMVAIMEVDQKKVSSYGIVKVDDNEEELVQIKQIVSSYLIIFQITLVRCMLRKIL